MAAANMVLEGEESGPYEDLLLAGDELPLFNIQVVKPHQGQSGILVDLKIEGEPVVMELDTGASVSIMAESTWKKTFPGWLCNIHIENISGAN